jgi:primosomal protein N' (replication factor Y)
MKIAEVALNVPIEENFYYIIPEGIEVAPYVRVSVEFGKRNLSGFVIAIRESETIQARLEGLKLKEIKDIIDKSPIINKNIIDIAAWISRFYLCPFGEALSAITPSAKNPKKYSHHFTYTGELASLNEEQIRAYETIKSGFSGEQKSFLIHGVTGSGKTEVYKHLVRDTLNNGKSAIILIPEIALTPQTLERFYRSFGDEVAIYHSKLTQNQRLGEWLRALDGNARVVIGPRSAIFAPLKNLGIIIIDEEHETSYKAQNSPRYNARQVAMFRTKQENAVLVLGSATPTIETYYFGKNGNLKLLELSSRYGQTQMPEVDIIDMTNEETGNRIISRPLMTEMMKTLSEKKQTLLFLNRRGYAPALMCKNCGFLFKCPNCDIALTLHKKNKTIECHHCEHTVYIPNACPSCKGIELNEVGSGTERIETMLSEIFPKSKVARIDLDTTKLKGSLDEILDNLRKGKTDIIIGTQMIAKGHDIAGINLVGAILPDIILSLPDFRSAERAFILLTQVIGRAGRRETRGKAFIQTFLPSHYAIQNAALQDYKKFYDREIQNRETFLYPPFVRLGRIVFRSKDKEKVAEFVSILKPFIASQKKRFAPAEILGPVSCPIEKLNNQYRYHIIIKAENIRAVNLIMKVVRDFFKAGKFSKSIYAELDIDPINMM